MTVPGRCRPDPVGCCMGKKAVLLLSGGLDSATLLALAVKEGYEVHAVTFRYEQRHSVEVEAARRVALLGGVKEHLFFDIPGELFRGTSLVGSSGEVPRERTIAEDEIPSTYVPGRNILFLSFALSYAEGIGSSDIFIGVNAVDYSGYPDCRPEFIQAYERMANIGTRSGVGGERFTFHVPLIGLGKHEIIILGNSLGVDYSLTHSCYNPGNNGAACGGCDSCRIRRKGFLDAGLPDPTLYA